MRAILPGMTRMAAWRIPSVAILLLLLAFLYFISPSYLGGSGPTLVFAVALQVVLVVLMAASLAFIVGYFFRLGWQAAARRQ